MLKAIKFFHVKQSTISIQISAILHYYLRGIIVKVLKTAHQLFQIPAHSYLLMFYVDFILGTETNRINWFKPNPEVIGGVKRCCVKIKIFLNPSKPMRYPLYYFTSEMKFQ